MIDFPASPTTGQQFSAGGVVWIWDGVKWTPNGVSTAYLPLSGGTLTGVLTLAADPTSALQAATMEFVTNSVRTRPSPLSFPFQGKPAANAKINVAMPWAATVAASLAKSVSFASTAAAASAAFTINKISGGVTTALGAATFAASGTTATFAGAGGSLAVGDVIQVIAPSTQDTALADISITIFVVPT